MYKSIQISLKNLSYLSFSKVINLFKLRKSYLFSRRKESSFKDVLPAFISVEPANFCQLHCPECPVGQMRIKKTDAKTINNLMFKKLIDELKSTLIHTIFYFQGEPFLDKNLPELIKYAHEAGIYTSTSTNGQLIDNESAKAIVESGLDKLIVSIDGTTQETYEKYRVGGSLKKTLEGATRIVEWKKKLNSPTPILDVQFLVLKTNEHQMDEMRKLSKRIGADKLTFKSAQLYDFENGHELLTTKKKYSRYEKRKDGKYHIKSKQSNRCWRLWSGAVVNTGGDILPCCFDKNSDFSFGNMNESSFTTCWHNEKASGFRRKILQNRKQFEMCRNCTS